MEIYIFLIDIGGDKQCWKGSTPADAMGASLEAFCKEQEEADLAQTDDPPAQQWQRLFRSCERVALLGNP